MKNLAHSLKKMSSINNQPIVVCSAQIRPHFKMLADRFMPRIIVLSYDEILSNIEIQSIDTLELDHAD